MTWKFTGGHLSVDPRDASKRVLAPCEPLAGIGEGPMEDAEFEARVARYEAQFGPEGAGSVVRSGMYVHEADKTEKPKPAAASGGAAPEQEA